MSVEACGSSALHPASAPPATHTALLGAGFAAPPPPAPPKGKVRRRRH